MRIPASRRLAAPLLISAALAAPATAAAAPNPLVHDLAVVNSHLRIGLESGPAELTEAMQAAKLVCGLGRDATARTEPVPAAADWTTLDQVVETRAEGAAHRVDTALANADSVLSVTGRRFGSGSAPRAPEIRHRVDQARHGIRIMLIAVQDLSRPFENWRAHECAAAAAGVEAAFSRAPIGMELINAEMQSLWQLSRPPAKAAKEAA